MESIVQCLFAGGFAGIEASRPGRGAAKGTGSFHSGKDFEAAVMGFGRRYMRPKTRRNSCGSLAAGVELNGW